MSVFFRRVGRVAAEWAPGLAGGALGGYIVGGVATEYARLYPYSSYKVDSLALELESRLFNARSKFVQDVVGSSGMSGDDEHFLQGFKLEIDGTPLSEMVMCIELDESTAKSVRKHEHEIMAELARYDVELMLSSELDWCLKNNAMGSKYDTKTRQFRGPLPIDNPNVVCLRCMSDAYPDVMPYRSRIQIACRSFLLRSARSLGLVRPPNQGLAVKPYVSPLGSPA